MNLPNDDLIWLCEQRQSNIRETRTFFRFPLLRAVYCTVNQISAIIIIIWAEILLVVLSITKGHFGITHFGVLDFQILILCQVQLVVYNTSTCLANKQPITWGWHLVSWIILGLFITVLLYPRFPTFWTPRTPIFYAISWYPFARHKQNEEPTLM